ncbi:MAG: flagellar biosynthesis regulator FlaF [Rhodobacteraceae bacterium]|nr:flagellar biosynthesis regulator FlaF [Paracoccaceae bacterium]
MNATQLATSAYGAAATAPLRTPRSVEHDVLARITGRIQSAAKTSNFPELAAALADNRRLWTLFATDVAEDDNDLPAQLRAQIFYLAEFTQHHTRRVLKKEASADVLIELNGAILRGLRGDGVPA